jgi:hypothetical protein
MLFITEARASLPSFIETPSTETIFEGLELQRIRLHHDQQISRMVVVGGGVCCTFPKR